MKKLEKRAILCTLLALVLVLGMGYFIVKLCLDGGDWAGSYMNRATHSNGVLSRGELYDINGNLILKNTENGMQFSEDPELREALVHITGDQRGNISTGANNCMADKLIGYNIFSGTYSLTGAGRKVTTNLDQEACRIAYEAMGYYSGTVGVYNYETGDLVCAYSSPNYDPANPPVISSDDKSGIYINRLFSSTTPPGSTFKLVTAAAVIENMDGWENWTYNCTGVDEYGPDKVTCMYPHGEVGLKEALSGSCNCAFGELANELGRKKMKQIVRQCGLTDNYDIDGITTKAGTFRFPKTEVDLAWAGVGQHEDMINPAGMMVYMGAIANGGKAVIPKLVDSVHFSIGLPASIEMKHKTGRMIDEETAEILTEMMRNNVIETYGEDRFPGLEVCAKSGTAEVDKTKEPNALFAGFINDENHPYAFIVTVEHGSDGTSVAGTIANAVLQKIVEND